MKAYKRAIVFLIFLIILLPAGIIIPEFFQAGDAWGEWSVKTVKEQTGLEPSGMKKTADTYRAPIPDYTLGKEDQSLLSLSANYIVSGLVGTGVIIILTLLSVKLFANKPSE